MMIMRIAIVGGDGTEEGDTERDLDGFSMGSFVWIALIGVMEFISYFSTCTVRQGDIVIGLCTM